MKHAILPIVALTALAVLLVGMPEAKATSCASPSRFPACINAGTGFDRGDSVAGVDIEHTGPKCADVEVFYTSPQSGEQKVGPQKKSFSNGWCHLEAIRLYNNCESAIEFQQPLFFADADPGRDRAVGPGQVGIVSFSRECSAVNGSSYRGASYSQDVGPAGEDAKTTPGDAGDSESDPTDGGFSDASDAASLDTGGDPAGDAPDATSDMNVCRDLPFQEGNFTAEFAYSYDGTSQTLTVSYQMMEFRNWYRSLCGGHSADTGVGGGGDATTAADVDGGADESGCTTAGTSSPSPIGLIAALVGLVLGWRRREPGR